jgi:hypothetical protein
MHAREDYTNHSQEQRFYEKRNPKSTRRPILPLKKPWEEIEDPRREVGLHK